MASQPPPPTSTHHQRSRHNALVGNEPRLHPQHPLPPHPHHYQQQHPLNTTTFPPSPLAHPNTADATTINATLIPSRFIHDALSGDDACSARFLLDVAMICISDCDMEMEMEIGIEVHGRVRDDIAYLELLLAEGNGVDGGDGDGVEDGGSVEAEDEDEGLERDERNDVVGGRFAGIGVAM